MRVITNNQIMLDEFRYFIDYISLDDIQEELQSVHNSTLFNFINLEKFDLHLSFYITTIVKVIDDALYIYDVEIHGVQLWHEYQQLTVTDAMIILLQKEMTKQIKSFL